METIFITGATSGIGLATVYKFNQKGFRLILCGRKKERLEEIKNNLTVPYHILNLDIRNYVNLKEALSTLPNDFSKIDVLVNNAGVALGFISAYEANLEDWDTMIDTNIKGLIGYTHAILPDMVKRNKGHIINIGSTAGVSSFQGGNVYGGTKAFVHQFSENLRHDLLGSKIRISVISPGLVKTELFNKRFKGDIQRENEVFEGVKALEPMDIAEAIYWVYQQPPRVNVNMIEIMPICQVHGNTFREKGPLTEEQ